MVKGWLGRRQARRRGVLNKMGACALCCSRLAEMYLESTEQVGPVGTTAKGGIGHKLGMVGGYLGVWEEGNVSERASGPVFLSGSRCSDGDADFSISFSGMLNSFVLPVRAIGTPQHPRQDI